ncbi:MAG: Flp pilus assembly complex ATPase component TadA, partial [Candidatus Omnitrophica bacterium]|nr:Flp pilus assembly complex ATPase component TadA [Candidatus Omnitrophota bacterium]
KIDSRVYNMPVTNLDEEKVDAGAIKLILSDTAKHYYGIFPLRVEKDILDKDIPVVATSDPQDIVTLDNLKLVVNMQIRPVLSSKSDISRFIEKYYKLDDALYDLLKNVITDAQVSIVGGEKIVKADFNLGEITDEHAPIACLVNIIFTDAVNARASDIHIEPRENFVAIRYRVDGDLRHVIKIPNNLHAPLSARIKVLSGLDVAESRRPQDGRASLKINERKIDIRISTIPTYYGEEVVLRLLDPKESRTELSRIGFEYEELVIFKESIIRPEGMILVTGPTGSGKTSTLYAGLNAVKSETRNIITVEDPIEYLIDGINQIQVNPQINVTFAAALRSILRQDPDVILVGEIRDSETAEIAFRASLTGHLVFSTMHTNSSVATINRLLDMGLEPYLVSSSIILIVAQRLVRFICQYCKEEHEPEARIIEKLKCHIDGLGIKKFYKGKGCQKCNFSGYFGRTAIFEQFKINEKIRAFISNKSSEDLILKETRHAGLRLLVESGLRKAAKGLTTLEEVARVADVQDDNIVVNKPVDLEARFKLLVADDEEDVVDYLQKRLAASGYDIIRACDGKQAIEFSVKERPDLILMDVNMPNMDGFEAIRILRSRLETASIPIMILTARQDKTDELKGLDIGADDYLTKPFDFEKLLARIKMLLKRRGK